MGLIVQYTLTFLVNHPGNQLTFLPWPSYWGLLTIMQTRLNNKLHFGQVTYVYLWHCYSCLLNNNKLANTTVVCCLYFGQTTNCIWPIQFLGFNPRLGINKILRMKIFSPYLGWLGAGWCLTEGPIYIYVYIYMDNHWVCLRENSEGNPGFYQLQHVSSVTCPTGFIVGCTSQLVSAEPPTAIGSTIHAPVWFLFLGGPCFCSIWLPGEIWKMGWHPCMILADINNDTASKGFDL